MAKEINNAIAIHVIAFWMGRNTALVVYEEQTRAVSLDILFNLCTLFAFVLIHREIYED